MRDKDSKLLEERYVQLNERMTNYESEYHTTVDLWDEKDYKSDVQTVGITVKFIVDPTEFEGADVFSEGGVDIQSITTDEPVTIGKKTFPEGTDALKLAKYSEWDDAVGLNQYILSTINSQVEVPEERYPRTN
tara:strand:+ start:1097 stop:1495 length:399 start_codon:yes stop_codon:yes gene_type:complete